MQPAENRRGHWSQTSLLLLAVVYAHAQTPTIRVPARLVSVPTLVLASGNRTVPNLQPADFRLFDNNQPREFHLDITESPVSVVIAVQANPTVRDYLPFIARIGN